MKKLLKIFPDKGSSQEQKLTDVRINEITENLSEIKSELENSSAMKTDEGFKLFAKLMRAFHEKKNLKILTLCRQIRSIDIAGGKASLNADDAVLDEISKSQEFYFEFKTFFESEGLGFNLTLKQESLSAIETLKYWLGDELEIKLKTP